ncbi:MAG: ABC transporter substrate-binding protein, partial [Actinomycetota bacterium]
AQAQQASGMAPTSMMIEAIEVPDPAGFDVDRTRTVAPPTVPSPAPPAGPRAGPPAGPPSVAAPVGAPAPSPVPLTASVAPAPAHRPDPTGAAPAGQADSVVAGEPARALPYLAGVGAVLVVLAAVAGFVLFGGDDDADEVAVAGGPEVAEEEADQPATTDATPTTEAVATTEVPATEPAAPPVDGPLTVGALLPETGSLASLAEVMFAAAELAVDDINAAGGVLGADVELVTGDSKDLDEEQVRAETERLIQASVDVIVGPLTTFDSRVMLEDPNAAELAIISPTATSSDLTTIDPDGRFFRTSPSEVTMGHVTAQVLIDSGIDRLAVIHIDDAYGRNLSENLRFRYAQMGGVVVVDQSYDAFGDVAPVTAELIEAGPDGIVIIGFEETSDILGLLREAGITPGPDGIPVFGVDANQLLFGDPAVLDGYRAIGSRIDYRPLGPFTDRLAALGFERFEWSPETYDATVIAALAAEVSGVTDGPELSAAIAGVTRDGEKCFDFAECKRMIAEGEDIDYDGLAGPYELTDDGDPRVASYLLVTYDGGESPNPELNQYVFSR